MDSRYSSLVESWQSELRRGLEHLRSGRLVEAEECFERAHGMAPDRPEVCYALGRARLRSGIMEEAEALLRAAWQGDRSLVSAAGTLARCLGIHGQRFDEAHAVLDEAVAEHGPLAMLQVIRSELLLASDRFEEARVAAEAALASPDSESERDAASAVLARALNREGIQHAERGDNEHAVFLFMRAAHLDPEWSSPHVNLGAALARMGMHERAMTAYNSALAVDPENPIAHENRGLLLRHRGDLARASKSLTTALSLDPTSRSAALSLALVYRELGDGEAAREVLSAALEHASEDPDLWFELGAVFAADNEGDDAEACWRRVLQIDPMHAAACASLADLLVREGRLQEAAIMAHRAQGTIPSMSGLVGPSRPRSGKQT